MRTLRRLARAPIAFTALLALWLAAPAAAQPAPSEPPPAPDVVANNLLRLGLERYEHGNLIGAIEAFERGYAVEPRPEFLFALGQAHRRRGDCDRADRYFGEFLATGPSAGQADAARGQLARCEPAPPPPPPAPAVATVAPPPPAPIVVPVAGRRDRIAWIAGGAGIALAASGVTLLWLAHDRAADADAATTYDRHHALAARARSFEVGGAIALSAAAVAGGVLAWRVLRGDERAAPVRVTLASHGYGLAVRGAF
ncbi:MAG: hypothetical protein IPH44_13215 [Myxococcales bacterium]|nr:hypothetical protein [Myxococcales bacterium]MBK7193987.1 hypothetical protein [Myxococcales bacterium]MBP6843397.1 hypothetical protein [Kofleriaceae bacterium]